MIVADGAGPVQRQSVEQGGCGRAGGGRGDAGEAERRHGDHDHLVAEGDQAAERVGPVLGGRGEIVDEALQQGRGEVERPEQLFHHAAAVRAGECAGQRVGVAAGRSQAVGGCDIGLEFVEERARGGEERRDVGLQRRRQALEARHVDGRRAAREREGEAVEPREAEVVGGGRRPAERRELHFVLAQAEIAVAGVGRAQIRAQLGGDRLGGAGQLLRIGSGWRSGRGRAAAAKTTASCSASTTGRLNRSAGAACRECR